MDGSKGVYQNLGREFILDASVLETEAADNTNTAIWIERKASGDRKIEAKSYVTTHIVEETDFTARVLPPILEMNSNALEISSPERYTLEFLAIKNQLIFSQFRGTTPGIASGGGSTFFGRKVLCLRIPEGIEVHSQYKNISVITCSTD